MTTESGRIAMYRERQNDDLYSVIDGPRAPVPSMPFETLRDKFRENRLLIVGSGESHQEIDVDHLAPDVLIMVLNHNFSIVADFLFYMDQSAASDLNQLEFHDRRIVIGPVARECAIRDVYFTVGIDCIHCGHSGAMALQLAQFMGFESIYLAGYDYKPTKAGTDYCYDEKKTCIYGNAGTVKAYLADFDRFGIRGNVFNLNHDSLLRTIKFADKAVLYGPEN